MCILILQALIKLLYGVYIMAEFDCQKYITLNV